MPDTIKNTPCPSCQKEFTCQSKKINQCDCSKVDLTSSERLYIGLKFNSCICNTCLLKYQSESFRLYNSATKNGIQDTLTVFILATFLFLFQGFSAQTYPGAAGQMGSTAIFKDSAVFVNWIKSCSIHRGFQDISNESLGFTSVGDESMALGKALSNGVISLGDGGYAVCEFENPVSDGFGFDFAVFENSIDDSFLELAFVEVSSDGVHFFRFKSHSLTDTSIQTGSFGSTDASKINNLAGKYRAGYGTPFDLHELVGLEGLDIHSITHIKVVDVVGNMDPVFASRDGFNSKVNDPWPTPYPSGGFDLDAIGIIHENKVTAITESELKLRRSIFPNPAKVGDRINLKNFTPFLSAELSDLSGHSLMHSYTETIATDWMNPGMYLLKINTHEQIYFFKLILE